MVSSEAEMDRCLKNGKASNKLILVSYVSSPYVNFLLRFINAHPGFNSVFYICKVFVPERFTFRKVEVSRENIAVFIPKMGPSTAQGESFEKVEHKQIQDYYTLKMFLRELSIQKFLPLLEEINRNLTEVHSPEQLTEQCFSRPCVIGLIHPSGSRSKYEINMLKSMSREF